MQNFYLSLIIFLFSFYNISFAQHNYNFIGTAYLSDKNDNSVILTKDIKSQGGAAYSSEKLDLEKYFEISFQIYLGNKDGGADGITFVIHNDKRGKEAYGEAGQFLGYGGSKNRRITPSIAVEFDTYQNRDEQNDPTFDHIAFLENGICYHKEKTYWHNQDNNFNLEDDKLHNFKLIWNPENNTTSVFFDGELIIARQQDLIQEVFKGESKVFWGFTASTGYYHNWQLFVFEKLEEKVIEKEAIILIVDLPTPEEI